MQTALRTPPPETEYLIFQLAVLEQEQQLYDDEDSWGLGNDTEEYEYSDEEEDEYK